MCHVRLLLACLALFSTCVIAAAQQTYTPVQPDNTLTPGDPIGVTPQPSTAGTHEAVSTTNGALSFFLPVLSLPQRGGWNLTLGYINTSPSWQMRQDSQTQIVNQQGAPVLTNITYSNNIVLYGLIRRWGTAESEPPKSPGIHRIRRATQRFRPFRPQSSSCRVRHQLGLYRLVGEPPPLLKRYRLQRNPGTHGTGDRFERRLLAAP